MPIDIAISLKDKMYFVPPVELPMLLDFVLNGVPIKNEDLLLIDGDFKSKENGSRIRDPRKISGIFFDHGLMRTIYDDQVPAPPTIEYDARLSR